MKCLSDKAGGWWRYDDTLLDQLFVPIEEWEEMYAEKTREWEEINRQDREGG